MRSQRFAGALLCAFLLAVGAPALASGFSVYIADAAASGKAGVAIANPTGASTVFYNPAGLSWVDNQLVMGATFIAPDSDFSPGPVMDAAWAGTYGNILDETYGQDTGTFFVPHTFFSWNLNDRVTLGAGIYSTYGLGVEWPTDFPGRYFNSEAELKSIFITPTISWKLNDDWSIGLGLNIVKTDVRFQRNIPSFILIYSMLASIPADPTPALALNDPLFDGVSVLDVDDWGWGVNLGIQGKMSEHTRLGFVFKSQVDLSLNGTLDFTFPTASTNPASALGPLFVDTTADMDGGDLPPVIGGGIAWIYDNWNAELDVTWTGWSSFDDVVITPDVPSLFAGEVLDTEWNDTMSIRLGGEYSPNDVLTLRGGIYWDEAPVPDETLSPILPDSDRWSLTLGLGLHQDKWSFDAFIQGVWLGDRDIETPNETQWDPLAGLFPMMLDGEYTESTLLIGFTWTYHWGK